MKKPHVIIAANFLPNYEEAKDGTIIKNIKLSEDRINLLNLDLY